MTFSGIIEVEEWLKMGLWYHCTLLLLYSLNTFSSFCLLFCLLLLNKVIRVHTWVSFWSKSSVWWKWLKNFTCVSRISLNHSYFQKFLNLTRETLTLLMKVWTNGFSINRGLSKLQNMSTDESAGTSLWTCFIPTQTNDDLVATKPPDLSFTNQRKNSNRYLRQLKYHYLYLVDKENMCFVTKT